MAVTLKCRQFKDSERDVMKLKISKELHLNMHNNKKNKV